LFFHDTKIACLVQSRTCILINLEFFSAHNRIGALVVLNEDFNVCRRSNHLRGLVEGLALVADCLAYFTENVRKFL